MLPRSFGNLGMRVARHRGLVPRNALFRAFLTDGQVQ